MLLSPFPFLSFLVLFCQTEGIAPQPPIDMLQGAQANLQGIADLLGGLALNPYDPLAGVADNLWTQVLSRIPLGFDGNTNQETLPSTPSPKPTRPTTATARIPKMDDYLNDTQQIAGMISSESSAAVAALLERMNRILQNIEDNINAITKDGGINNQSVVTLLSPPSAYRTGIPTATTTPPWVPKMDDYLNDTQQIVSRISSSSSSAVAALLERLDRILHNIEGNEGVTTKDGLEQYHQNAIAEYESGRGAIENPINALLKRPTTTPSSVHESPTSLKTVVPGGVKGIFSAGTSSLRSSLGLGKPLNKSFISTTEPPPHSHSSPGPKNSTTTGTGSGNSTRSNSEQFLVCVRWLVDWSVQNAVHIPESLIVKRCNGTT